MRKGIIVTVLTALFILIVLLIVGVVIIPKTFNVKKTQFDRQARIIIPQNSRGENDGMDYSAEFIAQQDSITAKVPLEEGEVIISVLNGNFFGNPMEEQFVVYRNLLEAESPVYLTFMDYDDASRSYKRVWSAPTAATRPGTISLFTQDLLGDRSVCAIVSGMNGLGEHTLTIFRGNFSQNRLVAAPGNELFTKIAEFRIDGTITIKEVERSQAYQMGIGPGQSYTISAYGRDYDSSNILDQVEIVYAYNTGNGLYEQTTRTRIPGSQIEQRRVRELLGNSRAFEEFITGLWYYTTPQGTIDKRQYIYFSPQVREIIFYGDETQQVFNWQNSSATRYGLYISSQNISVTTLRRTIDIELESLESIKVRVFEDVRLKIGVNAPYDGSYRKAGPMENTAYKPQNPGKTFIDANYDGAMGKMRFFPSGAFELYSGNAYRQGKYAFYYLNNEEVLELRSDGISGPQREIFLIEGENAASDQESLDLRKNLSLVKVRIGTMGIERLHEGVISLTLASP